MFDKVRILFHFNIILNAIGSTQNAAGASLDSHDAEETSARNCNVIGEGKRNWQGIRAYRIIILKWILSRPRGSARFEALSLP